MTRDNRLLSLCFLLWGLGEGLFLYIEPLYLRELGADPLATGTALSVAALAMAATHLPAGYLADRLGRRPLIISGLALGAAATLVMYLTRELWGFVAALAAYSFTGFVIAPINAYVAEARGAQSVQRALSLVYAGFWAGTIFSPALSGWIGQTWGLRTVFLIAFGLFVAATGLSLLLRPQAVVPPAAQAGRYAALFRNRPFLGYLALACFALAAMQIGLPFMPSFAQEVRGVDVGVVGAMGTVASLATVIGNTVLGHRSPRGAMLLALGMLMLGLLALLGVSAWPGLALAYAMRAGWSLAHTMTTAQAGRLVGAAEAGLAYGLVETVAGAAMIIGPLAAGALYALAPALPFQVSLALCAAAFGLMWWRAPRQDGHTAAPEAEPLPIMEVR